MPNPNDQDEAPPMIPPDLLRWLERRYPDRCPSPTLTLDDIRVRQGEVGVIRALRSLYDSQHSAE